MKKSGQKGKSKTKKSKARMGTAHRLRVPTLFLVILVIIVLIWSVWPMRSWLEQRKEKRDLEKEVAGVLRQNDELRQEIGKLNSAYYIELIARKDLGLVKPGEEAYIVIPRKVETTERKPKTNKDKNLWYQIYSSFQSLLK